MLPGTLGGCTALTCSDGTNLRALNCGEIDETTCVPSAPAHRRVFPPAAFCLCLLGAAWWEHCCLGNCSHAAAGLPLLLMEEQFVAVLWRLLGSAGWERAVEGGSEWQIPCDWAKAHRVGAALPWEISQTERGV